MLPRFDQVQTRWKRGRSKRENSFDYFDGNETHQTSEEDGVVSLREQL